MSRFSKILLFVLMTNIIAHKEYLHATRWAPEHRACQSEIDWLNTHVAGNEEAAAHLRLGQLHNRKENEIAMWSLRDSLIDPLWTDVWRDRK